MSGLKRQLRLAQCQRQVRQNLRDLNCNVGPENISVELTSLMNQGISHHDALEVVLQAALPPIAAATASRQETLSVTINRLLKTGMDYATAAARAAAIHHSGSTRRRRSAT